MKQSKYDRARESKVRSVLGSLHLSTDVLETISLRNASAEAPYHGYQHLLTVAINADCGAVAESLPVQDRRRIVLAALFHDVDHLTGRAKSDDENIVRAIDAWRRLCPRGLTLADQDAVASLIASTRYPHVEPATISEAILQDADLLQSLEPDGARFLAGLGAETGRDIPFDDSDFLSTHVFRTPWARELVRVALAPQQ